MPSLKRPTSLQKQQDGGQYPSGTDCSFPVDLPCLKFSQLTYATGLCSHSLGCKPAAWTCASQAGSWKEVKGRCHGVVMIISSDAESVPAVACHGVEELATHTALATSV